MQTGTADRLQFRSLWIDMSETECSVPRQPPNRVEESQKVVTREAVGRPSQSRGLCVSVSAASAAVATEEPKTQAKGMVSRLHCRIRRLWIQACRPSPCDRRRDALHMPAL